MQGSRLDQRSIEMEKRRGSPSGQVYLPPFFSSKQMHFKQAQGAPLLTMTNDSTWSFLSLLT